MQFDWASLFLFNGILSSILGTLLAFFIFQDKSRSNWFLATVLFCVALMLFERIIRFSGLYLDYPYFLFVSSPTFFFILPLIYWYQNDLIYPLRSWYLHFILPVLLLFVFPTFYMTGSQKLDMFLSGGNDPWWITLFYLFYVLVYFMAILKVNKKHRELLTSQFSDQVVDAHLFSNRIILAVIYLLICLPIFMLLDYLPPSFPNKILLQKSIFTLFSMIPTLILIAFFLPKKAALQAVVLPEVQPPSSKSDVIQWESIKQFMDKQQPYLNQDLSLTTLADLLDLSRTQLSALINAQAEKHFYDFINAYRIKYFVERIKQRDHEIYALESLALDSGFKSYTSFYRVFKRTYGMSPRVFIKKEKDRK